MVNQVPEILNIERAKNPQINKNHQENDDYDFSFFSVSLGKYHTGF